MKDQYIGDINDYRKYGLLRVLQLATRWRLGICWLKTPDDRVQNDGKKLAYLRNTNNESHNDPALFNALRNVVTVKKIRTIEALLRTGILGDTLSFAGIVPDGANERDAYTALSLKALHQAGIVFFDPDNGIEVKSTPYGRKNSSKYVYLRELEQFYYQGHSLLIYQHFPRVQRDEYIRNRTAQIRNQLGCGAVLAIRSAHVVFLLVSSRKHSLNFETIAAQIAVQWGEDFACEPH